VRTGRVVPCNIAVFSCRMTERCACNIGVGTACSGGVRNKEAHYCTPRSLLLIQINFWAGICPGLEPSGPVVAAAGILIRAHMIGQRTRGEKRPTHNCSRTRTQEHRGKTMQSSWVLDAVRANALGGGARLRLGPSPPTEQRKTKVFLRNLLSFGRVPDGRSDTLLKRSRPPLPHRLEAVSIQGNRSTASWANDLALRFQLTKPFGERVVAARARHRDLRITQ